MIDQRIMAYGADKEGITVSDEEVEASYRGMFGYYPDGTPTAAPTSEPFEATPTVTDEQLAILRYTETPLPTEESEEETDIENLDETVEEAANAVEETVDDAVNAAAETVEEAADVVEETVDDAVNAVEETVTDAVEEATEDIAADVNEAVNETAELIEDIVAEPTESAEPTVAPTPTVYTEDMFKTYESYYFANNFYYNKDFLKKEIKYELLQDKVKDMIEGTVPRTTDMVWARHILVETEEEALAALERINSGEEWGDVAADVSTDSTASDGGDLGWFTEGTMVQAFNDAAFSQEIGTISDPVQTDFGYHLIQIIAHEEHPYTSSQYQTAVDNAYQKWLDGYAEQLDVSFETDLTSVTPTDPAFVG
jgi:parvulin-like peptidyl-prolyl isomerase